MKSLVTYLFIGLLIWNITLTLKLSKAQRSLRILAAELHDTQAAVIRLSDNQAIINREMAEVISSIVTYLNPYQQTENSKEIDRLIRSIREQIKSGRNEHENE